MFITIAIPVFRNEGSLIELHERLVSSIRSNFDNFKYEIIFCDDGSDDGSLNVLKEILAKDSNVVIIKLSKNFGQHAANNAAFRHAKGDIVINMSADLQDPPEVIIELIHELQKGNDIVLAARESIDESMIKSFTSWLHYKLVRISVPNYPDKGFDFWAVNKKAFKAFMSYNDVIRRNQIDLLSIGFNVGVIKYVKEKRIHGKSQYNFLKRLNISLSQILATAFWPLRLASSLGIFFTISGFGYALYLFIMFFVRDAVFEGWTPIMMLILIIGGITMLMLGIIGEYLWRIYFETKRRPLYFIDEIIKSKKDHE